MLVEAAVRQTEATRLPQEVAVLAAVEQVVEVLSHQIIPVLELTEQQILAVAVVVEQLQHQAQAAPAS
jgi:hypothetical protein